MPGSKMIFPAEHCPCAGLALGEAWKIRLTKYTDKALAHRKDFDHLPTKANLDSK